MSENQKHTASTHEREHGHTLLPKFGADGTLTAVAVDADTNQLLMLAHMDADALRLTLQTGVVHYWSRSRQSLWLKGETSGNTQSLVDMQIDCDQDAVIVRVRQNGAGVACHTGAVSCFYRRVVPAGDAVVPNQADAPAGPAATWTDGWRLLPIDG